MLASPELIGFVDTWTPGRMLSGLNFHPHTATAMKTLAKTESEPPMLLEGAVWLDLARMSGVPCFRGTRLPVQPLFDWLEDGVALDQFVRDFQIDPRAAEAVLRARASAVRDAAARSRSCAKSS